VDKNLGCGDGEIMLQWQFGEALSGRGRWLRVGRMWIPMMRDILKMERIIAEVIVIKQYSNNCLLTMVFPGVSHASNPLS
jgi:hypothetical protein